MKKTLIPTVKERSKSSDLVRKLITLLPLKLTSDKEFTQQYAASLIGCHRFWFRNHKGRYNIQTGATDQRGLTPRDMIKVFEEERTREVINSPLEFALMNVNAKVDELLRVIKALEEKIEAQRRSLHIISIYRYKLGVAEQKIFMEGLDEPN
jgi:hypothetical protein